MIQSWNKLTAESSTDAIILQIYASREDHGLDNFIATIIENVSLSLVTQEAFQISYKIDIKSSKGGTCASKSNPTRMISLLSTDLRKGTYGKLLSAKCTAM
jgi:hypothetical protein